MKKTQIAFLCIIVSFVCSISVFAVYSDIYALYESWEQNGYPDYVAGVYSTDGSYDNLTVQLVGDTDGTLEDQLRSQLERDDSLTVEPGSYSYNRLLEIQDEIVQEYMLQGDGTIVGCGVGWGSDGGFGPSGKESRVVVTVRPENLDTLKEEFQSSYGAAVVVEPGEAVDTDTAAPSETITTDTALMPGEFTVGNDSSAQPGSSAITDAPPAQFGETSAADTPAVEKDGAGGAPSPAAGAEDQSVTPVPMPAAHPPYGAILIGLLLLCLLAGGVFVIIRRKK